ncbi:MAG: SAM-dependent methyltransferase, partial [Proteobacteria bacterium]|nr:SAM-dependent methyltransferase [Pseudomonadota bacterium]
MRHLFLATLLISAAAIAYEILLMRMLSIVQWHHFAYMIISLALLGYGASGTFIALCKRWLQPRFEWAFSLCGLLFSVTMVGCFVLGQRVPFNALEIVWDSRQFAYLAVTYLVFFVPFFFAASCIGLAFTCRPSYISRIYFFDLLGAGLGAMLIVGSLFVLSPQEALIM